MNQFKKDFPLFLGNENKNLVYLDNAASTQKPSILMDTLSDYYMHSNSNIGRGVYSLAEKSYSMYENSRKIIANFIGSESDKIVFSSGCTASLNQTAYIAGQHLKSGQKIVLSILEHHANILPWQRLAKEKGLEIVYIKDNDFLLYPEKLPSSFWNDVGLISLTHVSNVTGQIIPVEKWCKIAKEKNIISVIDGAQGICSLPVNVKNIDCDFYAFSAHKLYGPMGLGILYVSDKYIKSMPFILGGGIIEDVLEQEYILLDYSVRHEAGTPNVANVVAFAQVIEYLNQNSWNKILNDMHATNEYLYQSLNNHSDVIILNNSKRNLSTHSHIVSFYIQDIHAHDIGTFLSNENIAVRVGKHCTHPLHEFLHINSSVRVSLGMYNSIDDIDYFMDKLSKCIHFFRSA